jgi:hypothetical protein
MKSDINIRKRTASKMERDGNVRPGTQGVLVAPEAAVPLKVMLRQWVTMFVWFLKSMAHSFIMSHLGSLSPFSADFDSDSSRRCRCGCPCYKSSAEASESGKTRVKVVIVSKVAASKVVVVKKDVTGKLMHEADSKVLRYIPSLHWIPTSRCAFILLPLLYIFNLTSCNEDIALCCLFVYSVG